MFVKETEIGHDQAHEIVLKGEPTQPGRRKRLPRKLARCWAAMQDTDRVKATEPDMG